MRAVTKREWAWFAGGACEVDRQVSTRGLWSAYSVTSAVRRGVGEPGPRTMADAGPAKDGMSLD